MTQRNKPSYAPLLRVPVVEFPKIVNLVKCMWNYKSVRDGGKEEGAKKDLGM